MVCYMDKNTKKNKKEKEVYEKPKIEEVKTLEYPY